MSSNHTYISNREWEEMQERVATTEAYVIRSQQETQRLLALAEARRREAQRLDQEARQRITAARNELVNSYREAISRAGSRLTSEINARSAEFEDQLDALRRNYATANVRISEMNRDIAAIGNQFGNAITDYWDQIGDRKTRAELFIGEMNRLMDQIQTLNPELHVPGDLALLRSRLTTAENNVRCGDYQAALDRAQSGITDAGTLLTRLTILQEQYLPRMDRLRDSLSKLGDRIEQLSSSEGTLEFPLCGAMQQFDYDIDRWSNGEFGRITDAYRQIQSQLDHLPATKLGEMEQLIAQLDDELTDCDRNARREFAGSISVQHMAEELGVRFEHTGWQPVSEGWTDNDEQKPYTMLYRDGAGNDVSIVISTGADPENPLLSFEVYSDNEYRAAATKEGLISMLPELGMQPGAIERRNDCHINPTPQAFLNNTVQEAEQRRRRRSTLRSF